MKIWCFHGQYKANSLGTNEILYNIFHLRHMSKVAAHIQKKSKMFIYKESGKVLKTEDAKPYLEPCQISMMERFCESRSTKSFIIDVWYYFKYSPVVVQDSKINLKWIITKMLEKTVHFLNVNLAEDIST